MRGMRAVIGESSGQADRSDSQGVRRGSRELDRTTIAARSSNDRDAPLLGSNNALLDDSRSVPAAESDTDKIKAGGYAIVQSGHQITTARIRGKLAGVQFGFCCISPGHRNCLELWRIPSGRNDSGTSRAVTHRILRPTWTIGLGKCRGKALRDAPELLVAGG